MAALVNHDAEQVLLGKMLGKNETIDVVSEIVAPDDFSEDIHGRIYATALSLRGAGKDANPVTLRDHFANDAALGDLGGVQYLMQLTEQQFYPTPAKGLAEQIRDLSKRRRMREGFREAASLCEDVGTPEIDILEGVENVCRDTASRAVVEISAADAVADLARSLNEKPRGVNCKAIPSLDRALGPARPSQMIIVAARPGMGKTALAISYSLGVAKQGHGVIFVSLEMRAPELSERMVAEQSFGSGGPIPYSAVRDRTMTGDQQKAVARFASSLHGLPLSIIDAGGLTMDRLASLVRRRARLMEAQGTKLSLVVIDYLQLLRATEARGRYEEITRISIELKALAKELDVAIMPLAQLSREVEKRPDKRPQLSDLRDSGQIEQDADAVVFLLRPEYYLRQEEPQPSHPDRLTWESALSEAENKIEFIVAKRRNGVAGTAEGEFHGAYQAVR